MMLQSFSNEVQPTKKVISAIPENKRDYRPDPHARTAWELAWHLANSDIQFLGGIADLKFSMATPEQGTSPRPCPNWFRGTSRITIAPPTGYVP
jgi:hypothetical protein